MHRCTPHTKTPSHELSANVIYGSNTTHRLDFPALVGVQGQGADAIYSLGLMAKVL